MTDAASALAPAARTSPTGHDGARTPAASNPRPASVTARCPCCAAVPVVGDPVLGDGADFAPRVHGTRWPTLRDVVLAWERWTHRAAVEAEQRAPQGGELAAAGGGVGGHAGILSTAALGGECP